MNALTIITEAMKVAEIFDPEETLDNATAEHARNRLNRMLDAWSVNRLMVYARTEDTFSLTANDGQYSIGESGTPDINTVRPVKVEEAFLRDTTVSPNYDRPLIVINQPEYNRISVKALQAPPTRLYFHPSVPNGTIYFDYLPDIAYELHLFSWKAFTAFADLTTEYDFPPGYEAAITANLAIRLPSVRITEIMALEAKETMSALKNVNAEIPKLSCGLVPGARRGGFDVIKGD